MTIKAPVFKRDPKTLEQLANLGVFEFEQLPAPGDFFNIARPSGAVEEYRVIGVAHEPNREGERLKSDQYRAFVYVTFINLFGAVLDELAELRAAEETSR